MVLTPDQLHFLARLSKSPDGAALVSILRADLSEADVKLRKAIGDDLIRTQGRAQMLDELVERLTSGAQKTLNTSRPTPVARRPGL